MNLLNAISRMFRHVEDDPVLDFVPAVKEAEATDYSKRVAEAKQRHGREFHCNEVKARETARSYDLTEIDRATAEERAKANATALKVTLIARRRT